MLFSSIIFIFIFLPLTIFLFYLVPKSLKNTVLLIFSLVFYAWGGVSYTIILISSILINYLFGFLITKYSNQRKILLSIGVGLNLSILVVFKYSDFIIDNINRVSNLFNLKHIDSTNIVLPIGISFFTFQAISYLVDIYRKEVKYQKSLINMALYISLFPQLIAGPIVRYHDIANQLIKRTFTMQKFGNGVERFIIGLGKKVLLANNFALVADNIFGMSYVNISTPEAWLGIIAYSFQIYFDFAGYSDMAIGLGKMFGFTFLENFNFPYISKSIKEFWRRWHISLSTWFRDYLYIPLGGNRVAYYRIYINLMIVFVLTGFWHGASWSFLFWGIFHGFFLIIEKLGIDRVLTKLWAPLQHAYALFVVIIGWVFFRVETIQQAFLFVKKMFIPTQSTNTIYSYFDIQFICVTIVAILGAFGFFPWIANHIKPYISKSKLLLILFSNLYIIVLISIFILTIFYLMSGSYNPFIYFRF